MSDGITCYEQDETLCADPMCLRTGCRLRNERLAATPAYAQGLEACREALEGLIEAVVRDANEPDGRGISGYTSARLSDARAAIAALPAPAGVEDWQPIETAILDGLRVTSETFILGHAERKWIRFGKWYVQERCWYYSATNERSKYAQLRGDDPTHWRPLPAPPNILARPAQEGGS